MFSGLFFPYSWHIDDEEKEKEMEEFIRQHGYKFEGHKEVDHIFRNSC